ncbi:MAG: hypothetical protein HZB13_01345, partial [Acidobacteria bacterium]|nr:hypothetical protein [Acidobacteriota bacterium]
MMRLATCLLAALALSGQTDPAALLEKKTRARIAAIDQNLDGALGVAAIDLKSGRVFSHNGGLV